MVKASDWVLNHDIDVVSGGSEIRKHVSLFLGWHVSCCSFNAAPLYFEMSITTFLFFQKHFLWLLEYVSDKFVASKDSHKEKLNALIYQVSGLCNDYNPEKMDDQKETVFSSGNCNTITFFLKTLSFLFLSVWNFCKQYNCLRETYFDFRAKYLRM